MTTNLVAPVVAPLAELVPGAPAILLGSHCALCDRAEFPVRATCPSCGAVMNDLSLGPDARLRGFTAVLHQPPGALVQAPYVVGVAEFTAGIAVLGLLVGAGYDELCIGDRVRVVLTPTSAGLTYAYEVAPDASSEAPN